MASSVVGSERSAAQPADDVLCAELRELLNEPNCILLSALTDILHMKDIDVRIKEYPYAMYRDPRDLPFLRILLRREIETTRENISLFRETTSCTLLISSYVHMIGHRYLRNVISPVMREVSEEKYKDSDTAAVVRISGILLRRLTHKLRDLPDVLLLLNHYLLHTVLEKFPNDKYTALGGFFLLRVVCPVITAPDRYGMIPAGVEIDLQFRKFCAMVSKLLLMASIGSSFSQPGMGELNEYLKQASTDVLRMLDHLADIGMTLAASVVVKKDPRGFPIVMKRRSNSRRVSRALTRRQRRSLAKTQDFTSQADMDVWMPDMRSVRVSVDRYTSAATVLEIFFRLQCPAPATEKRLHAFRAAHRNCRLFMGSGPKSKQKKPPEPNSEDLLLVEDDDLIWVGEDAPTYVLWFLPVLSDVDMVEIIGRKERTEQLMSLVSVYIEGNETKKTFQVSRNAVVDDMFEFVYQKLAKEKYGKVNEKGTEEMKKLYADYWLYAAASPEPRLLYSHDYAVHRKSYNTRPADLYFKKCPEQHQRAVARMRARISHQGKLFANEEGFMRVKIPDGGVKTIQITRETNTLDALELLFEKLSHESDLEGTRRKFSSYWLFRSHSASVQTKDATPPDSSASRTDSHGFRPLARSVFHRARSLSVYRPRSGSSGGLEKPDIRRLSRVWDLMLPGERVWRKEIEPEVELCQLDPDCERELRAGICSFLQEAPAFDHPIPIVFTVHAKLRQRACNAVRGMVNVFLGHWEDITQAAWEAAELEEERAAEEAATWGPGSARRSSSNSRSATEDEHSDDEIFTTASPRVDPRSRREVTVDVMEQLHAFMDKIGARQLLPLHSPNQSPIASPASSPLASPIMSPICSPAPSPPASPLAIRRKV